MLTIDPARSALLVIDFQERLMPAIDQAGQRLDQAARLIRAAEVLGLPRHVTEQNPARLGGTVPMLEIPAGEAMAKMDFDAARDPAIAAALAVNPESLGHLAPWFLGAAVTCWVAGFDVLYALLDPRLRRGGRV